MEYISALIFPFFILLIENFLPYPYIIEELFKFFLAKKSKTVTSAIILGVLFSFSEGVFYFLNPSYSIITDFTKSILRLAIVTPMHTTTILIMWYFSRKKKMWPLGIFLAIAIHYLFNLTASI